MAALPSVADLLSGQTGYERGAQAFDNGYNGVRGMRVNDLAKSYFTGDPSTRDATLQQIAAINPQAADNISKWTMGQETQRNMQLANIARGVLSFKDPAAQRGVYQNTIMPAAQRQGLQIPEWDDATTPQWLQYQLARGNGAAQQNPYSNLPADVQSLMLIRDNPKLAELDMKRKQAAGMIPKLAQTAQGYAWGTPGGGFDLAPINGVAGQQQSGGVSLGGDNPVNVNFSDLPPEENQRIAQDYQQLKSMGLPEDQINSWMEQQLRQPRVRTGAGQVSPQAQAAGGIAQPYQKPETITPYQQESLALAKRTADRADAAASRAERGTPPAGYRWNAGGTALEPIPGAPLPNSADKANEGEKNAAGFYERMRSASDELNRIEQSGYDPTNLRDFTTAGSTIGNYMTSDQGQRYYQAKMNWVRANLRKESGAAIGVDEAKQEIRNYFPVPGDSPETIKQKARNRAVTEDAMLKAAGRAAPQGNASQPSTQQPGNYSNLWK